MRKAKAAPEGDNPTPRDRIVDPKDGLAEMHRSGQTEVDSSGGNGEDGVLSDVVSIGETQGSPRRKNRNRRSRANSPKGDQTDQ